MTKDEAVNELNRILDNYNMETDAPILLGFMRNQYHHLHDHAYYNKTADFHGSMNRHPFIPGALKHALDHVEEAQSDYGFVVGVSLYKWYRGIREKYPEPITAEEILMLEKLEQD